MIVRGFKPVGWVAAVATAALGCYMLSLNVASERAELERIERQIIIAKQEIRSLQTELGTRGRLAQLDRWNAEVLALSAPTSAQYLDSAFTLARFDQQEKTIEERAQVHMAAAISRPVPEVEIAPGDFAAAVEAAREPRPVVHRAAYVPTDEKPFKPVNAALQRTSSDNLAAMKPAAVEAPAAAPATRQSSLLDDKLVAEIGAVARSEKKQRGSGGQ